MRRLSYSAGRTAVRCLDHRGAHQPNDLERRTGHTPYDSYALGEWIKALERVPRLIQPLCTSRITALTEERGIKVTSAAARLPESRRKKVAEQLIEALVAVPLLSSDKDAIFHGDPHAGADGLGEQQGPWQRAQPARRAGGDHRDVAG